MTKIKVFSIFSIIFFFLLNHFIFTTFQIKSYNTIAFIDHDLGYLVEQLLLKLNFLEITRLVSHPAEYGVEFYYLSYLFNFLNIFFNLNTINIFYLVTIFHLISVFFTFYIVYRFFKKINIDLLYFVLFVLIIILSPVYTSNISHFKPDANLFMLSIISTIYFFNSYIKKNKVKNLLLAIFFSSLASSVKFFGLFFIFSFLYFFFIASNRFKLNLSQIYCKFLLFLNVIFIIIWLYFFFNFLDNGYLDNLLRKGILNINYIKILSFFLHYHFIILISFLFLAIIYIFFYKKKIFIVNFFLILNIFFLFSYIISIPIIFNYKTLISTIVGFYAYTNLTKETTEFLFFSNYINFLIVDFKYGLLNIVSFFIIILSLIFHFCKKIILPKIYIFISIYFLLMIFIMPLIWPANRMYLIRISIFYLQFILFFISISIIIKHYKFGVFNKYFLILSIIVYFVFYQNFNKVNLFQLYSHHRLIQNQVNDLNVKLNKYHNSKNNFYFCGGFFPYYQNKNYFEKMTSDCLSSNFLRGMSKDDYIIFAIDHIYPKDFLLYESLVNNKIIYHFDDIVGKKTRMNGEITEMSFAVIKKKTIN